MKVEPEHFGARRLFGDPLAAAVMEVVVERGFEAATIEEICLLGGVERSQFDRRFADKAAAVLATFEAYIEDFEIRVAAAYNSAPTWPDNLRAAAYASSDWIQAYPLTPRFGMLEMSDAEEMARVRRESVLRWCAGLVDGGREVAPDPTTVSQNTAMIVVGSVAQIVTREAPHPAEMARLIPDLMYVAVRPYLGEEAARRELAMPRPEPA